ncbi:MAG: hypothetical protein ACE10D_13380 [Planctomycetota bacterium]|nr:hypothetical protein [Planctomycetota bacterium]
MSKTAYTLLYVLTAALFSGCGSPGAGRTKDSARATPAEDTTAKAEAADPPTRVTLRQFVYKKKTGARVKTPTFIVENYAGRDIGKLRSRTLRRGQPVPAYVEDEVMRELLKYLKKYDFYKYAIRSPSDPEGLGARGEIRLQTEKGSQSLLFTGGLALDKRKLQYAYRDCRKTVLAVYDATPKYQFTRQGKEALKVKRVPK